MFCQAFWTLFRQKLDWIAIFVLCFMDEQIFCCLFPHFSWSCGELKRPSGPTRDHFYFTDCIKELKGWNIHTGDLEKSKRYHMKYFDYKTLSRIPEYLPSYRLNIYMSRSLALLSKYWIWSHTSNRNTPFLHVLTWYDV